jgi:hypothetical protein
MSLNPSFLRSINDKIMAKFGTDTGKMLIHTGVIGWILSSLAQVTAIVINDKIPTEQKMFLVPQEMADALVNIVSFYAVTQTFNSVAKKLVTSGKWLPKTVKDVLVAKGLGEKLGKKGFDVLTHGGLSGETLKNFNSFKTGIDVGATTLGSVLSCNIITPLLRNVIAANRQQDAIARMNKKNSTTEISNTKTSKVYLPKPSMNSFQAASALAYSPSTGLKI